jgi:putative PEP-CTERM system TPR-repeat lipoprotein
MFFLPGGCTTQHKTKEQLVTEGIQLLQKKDARGAIIRFKNALETDQNYFEARLQLAKTYNLVGNFKAAEKELEKVRRQDPSSREVRIELARVMAFTNRPDEALKELSSYLGDNKADCDALEIAGWAYSIKEDTAVAISLLKKAIAQCGEKSISPVLSLASVYAGMGDTDEAEAQINRVLARDPENRTALYLLVDVQTRRKDAASAANTLDRIIKANPNDTEAQYRKGLWHLERSEFDNALAASQAIIKKFPDRPEGHRLQGFALFFKKQYSDAVAPLQKTLLMQPNAGAYYMLGLVHYHRKEVEQAANQFQKALDLQPTFVRARAHLALLNLSRKRPDDAITEAKKALEQDNDNALAHNVLGSAYLAKGNNE